MGLTEEQWLGCAEAEVEAGKYAQRGRPPGQPVSRCPGAGKTHDAI
ncbi:hypothetical protein LT337_17795 [Mycolicibacterium fortuitum]|nr:hypothetical protein LT337_17795 [Mycolicibacterium fortuitum]